MEASFRLALYLAARTIRRLGLDETMQQLMVVFWWLSRALLGGVLAVSVEFARVSVWAAGVWPRHGSYAADIPRLVWMKVSRVLEKLWCPPGSYVVGVPPARYLGGAMRLCPVRSNHVLPGRVPVRSAIAVPSKPARPTWG